MQSIERIHLLILSLFSWAKLANNDYLDPQFNIILMKKILATAFLALTFYASNAQEINFIEYDLDNGLHVILHQDNTAPVITTAVSYHVGSKDE